jgi:hypothetical protein
MFENRATVRVCLIVQICASDEDAPQSWRS